MSAVSDRLQSAREAAGYATVADAARAIGVSRYTYGQHENGIRGLKPAAAMRYSRFYRVSLEWLLTGRGERAGKPMAPVVGYVGAGAEVHPIDDFPKGTGLDMVESPPGVPDCVAARIRGTSMHPLKDGWLIFWNREASGVPEDCIGELCVVQITNGPTLLKDVRRGVRKGRYRLESWNEPPREDVLLAWASRVIDIRPR